MTRYLLDTHAVYEFAKPEPNAGFLTWARRIDPALTYLSAITIGELYYGIGLARETQRLRLESWLADDVFPEFGTRVLAFDSRVAQAWGTLRALARRDGATLSPIDAAIAATAAHYGLTIVTRNESDFSPTPVPTYNPWD